MLYMPRKARKKSESGIYHIMMRGINRQSIFEDDEDYLRFIQTLQLYKQKSEFELYAYCLMGNHVHLLLRTGKEPLEQVMRRICGSYVYWYNTKYERVGNLFQDRFKSEPVENDASFLYVQRYIHQNPFKAGVESEIGKYKWNSYNEYVGKTKIINAEYTFDILSNDRESALKNFVKYTNEVNDDACLDLQEKRRSISDQEARMLINEVCDVKNAIDVQKFDIKIRNACLKKLKEDYCLSIRQIERITGINRGIVLKS